MVAAGSVIVLVPTTGERELLDRAGPLPAACRLVTLGAVGPVAAAARAMQILGAREAPPRVSILLGIAGTLDPAAVPPGEARLASRLTLDGVGVGEGEHAGGMRALGLPQLDRQEESIWDAIDLEPPLPGVPFLTVTSAAGDAAHARRRRARHPEAVLEEMEGFGVALASRLAGIPHLSIRGVSNPAGDRRRETWRSAEAMRAAHDLLERVLEALP